MHQEAHGRLSYSRSRVKGIFDLLTFDLLTKYEVWQPDLVMKHGGERFDGPPLLGVKKARENFFTPRRGGPLFGAHRGGLCEDASLSSTAPTPGHLL